MVNKRSLDRFIIIGIIIVAVLFFINLFIVFRKKVSKKVKIIIIVSVLCILLCYIVNKTFNIEPVKYLYKYLDDIQREYKGV